MKTNAHLCLLLVVAGALTGCSRPSATVKDAHWETQLSSGIPGDPGGGAYSPKPGYRFLIVNVEMNFGASSKLSSEDIRVVTTDGKSYPAVGIKLGPAYMMGGFSGDFGKSYAGPLVFHIPEGAMEESFSLRYKELASAAFSVTGSE